MGVRIVRAIRRTAVRMDAGSVRPGLNVASGPDAALGMLSFALSSAVSAIRVSRPIQRQTIACKPLSEIALVD